MIQQNIDQAQYLAGLVKESERLELLAPVPLNVVCFRYLNPGLAGEDLDDLNQRILVRSRWEDFDLLVSEVIRLGELTQRERS